MTTAEEHKSDGIGKDLVVYVCLLALAGLQFVIAYQKIDTSQMFWRMLVVAIVEAGLAVLFFMHLWAEKRTFLLFVAHLYDFCPAGDAIWVDRRLPNAGRRAIFKMTYARERRMEIAMLGKKLRESYEQRCGSKDRSCWLVLRWLRWSCSPLRSRPSPRVARSAIRRRPPPALE